MFKEDNETLTEVGGSVEAVAADAGKALFARAEAGFDVSDPVYVALVADWTGFSGGDDALSKGNVFGVGPAVATRLGGAGKLQVGRAIPGREHRRRYVTAKATESPGWTFPAFTSRRP